MREPDEERGCGPDGYDIGEGVISLSRLGEYNIRKGPPLGTPESLIAPEESSHEPTPDKQTCCG